jgi:hypothetical protein
MKKLMLTAILTAFCALTHAGDWEYKVLHFPPSTSQDIKNGNITPTNSGAYLDAQKTKILNELSKDDWELVSTSGKPGIQIAYLRRASTSHSSD